MIDFEPLSESRHSHFAEKLFESAFPEEERPPFRSLEDRDERFHFLVATIDDEPLGILTYWVFEEFVYIEHFAIDKEFRNQGLGKAAIADKKVIDKGVEEMTLIAGQRAVPTKSKKDISNFKLRRGMPIGVRVTLRGERMYEFLEGYDSLLNLFGLAGTDYLLQSSTLGSIFSHHSFSFALSSFN